MAFEQGAAMRGVEVPEFRDDQRSAFHRAVDGVRRAATVQLGQHRTEGAVVAFVRNAQDGIDRVFDDAARSGARIDCKPGCSHCCSARVEAIAPEIFRIVDALAGLAKAERDATWARLRAHAEVAEADAPGAARGPCPFLVEQRCSIYPVRPAACRKAHSADVTHCAAGAATIPQDVTAALKAEALLRGTVAAYDDTGVDATRYELVAAILVVLDDPSARTRWFDGARVFDRSGR